MGKLTEEGIFKIEVKNGNDKLGREINLKKVQGRTGPFFACSNNTPAGTL
jgi:hypothetical protein